MHRCGLCRSCVDPIGVVTQHALSLVALHLLLNTVGQLINANLFTLFRSARRLEPYLLLLYHAPLSMTLWTVMSSVGRFLEVVHAFEIIQVASLTC